MDPTLADTFDADGADSDEENDGDDRQRLMRGVQAFPTMEQPSSVPATRNDPVQRIERRPTQLPVFTPTSTRIYGGGSGSDGVFANLAAKPEAGEKMEEHPPVSYSYSPIAICQSSHGCRRTSKQQQTPHLRIGRRQSSRQDSAAPTRSTLMASPLARSSPSSGTA